MSQKVTRKSAVSEEKEKRQTDSPVKEMKKKMAANAEKEKLISEKNTEKSDKHTDKSEKNTDKSDKTTDKSEKADKSGDKNDKAAEKTNKAAEKTAKAAEKTEKTDKAAEKSDKSADKKTDKSEKKEELTEKVKEDGKGEKSGKQEKHEKKNGRRSQNGVQDSNGIEPNGAEEANGTVSGESDEDAMLVIDDHDELFPELTYDDTSDVECFELPTPDPASRSLTRRSQVKSARTPETPRPASDKQPDSDDSKESKVLKMKDDPPTTDRKLRSADSPKPQEKKEAKKDEKESKREDEKETEKEQDKDGDEKDVIEVDVTVELESNDAAARKAGTNFSKSRVKVSPYRRSHRLADQTNSSLLANYTGNNTTMEMDITESSSFLSEEGSADDSYLRGLRAIRGRSSYKQLKDMPLRHTRRTPVNVSAVSSDSTGRPTGAVVGRKRKPEDQSLRELLMNPLEDSSADGSGAKKMKIFERFAMSFKRTVPSPLLPRRAAEIVGINTDLPLTAPVASPEAFDPESLKSTDAPTTSTHLGTQAPTVIVTPAQEDRETKKCIIM